MGDDVHDSSLAMTAVIDSISGTKNVRGEFSYFRRLPLTEENKCQSPITTAKAVHTYSADHRGDKVKRSAALKRPATARCLVRIFRGTVSTTKQSTGDWFEGAETNQ
jgi:hypothetical protein